MTEGAVRVGMSGWVYPPWRGVFYPTGLPHRDELDYAARCVTSIEINGSFYALQRPASYRNWYTRTPPGFVFAVKAPRFITHMKKLRDVDVPLANFFSSGLLGLREKLGPILWQLPPNLGFDAQRIADFTALLPRSTAEAAWIARRHDDRMRDRTILHIDADRPLRHAIEVRHPSFLTPAFTELMREQRVAVVLADTAGAWPVIDEVTADFAYLRLHGDDELYVSGYTPAAIEQWAGRVRARAAQGLDVYVYFDNDAKVRSPQDAVSLLRAVGTGVGPELSPPLPRSGASR